MIIDLKGSNKKLLHKAGMYIKKANSYAKINNVEIFKLYNREANRTLELLTKKLKIDESINFIAPCTGWNSIKIFTF